MNDQLLQLGIKKRNKEITLSWQEIADKYSDGLFTNGETLRLWVKDKLRKTEKLNSYVAGVKGTFETNSDNFLKEKEELLKLKTQYQDQKREYANLVRQQARFEHLKEEILKAIIDLSTNKPLFFNPPSPARSNVRANTLWSDWHVGADFENSLNRYDINVFRERLQVLINKIICEGKKYNVDTLTIGALGDFISGAIHVSTRVQANEDVIQQIQIVSESIAECLAELSKHFRSIKFINIIGNHARLISNKNESIFTENLENLIPWFLEARLKDFKNIEIYRDMDGYYVDRTFEQTHIYVHGDLDHVSSAAKALPQMLGIVPRYIFCGHIHHDTVKEYGRTKVISNGSMIGVDDYAISKRFYAEPMQKMHIFDDKDRIEHTIDIYLN
ncbi:hypothetical protein Elgi_36690 [Paenibacillus elgii]|uniref:hypothetical protein n=1 Tax=Paenibacillus elgii TaxID=189691 RepID=UPI002D7CD62C|nr:hypothetical protein Elgi_36690 [Paenibacillus elgii]